MILSAAQIREFRVKSVILTQGEQVISLGLTSHDLKYKQQKQKHFVYSHLNNIDNIFNAYQINQ